jgi:hypothetical protein
VQATPSDDTTELRQADREWARREAEPATHLVLPKYLSIMSCSSRLLGMAREPPALRHIWLAVRKVADVVRSR